MSKHGRLIVHIGQGKTGSTSIQNALKNNPETLERFGVFFPITGRHTNHQDIFTFLTGDVKHHDPALGGARDDARKTALGKTFWEAARERILREQPDVTVLSCENQFRPFSVAALESLSRHLTPLFAEIRVVAYLRSPAEHFLSMAQQDVKKRPKITIPPRNALREVLEPWTLHGPGPVEVIRYARDTLQDGDVVADFCARFLPVAAADLARPSSRDNTTLSPEAMAVLQDFHRGKVPPPTRFHGARAQRMKDLIQRADSAEPGFQKPRLAAGLKQAIEARAGDLDWLKTEFGLEFPDLERTALPAQEAYAHVERIETVAQVCAVDEDRKRALLTRMTTLAVDRQSWIEKLLAKVRK